MATKAVEDDRVSVYSIVRNEMSLNYAKTFQCVQDNPKVIKIFTVIILIIYYRNYKLISQINQILLFIIVINHNWSKFQCIWV